MTIIAIYVKPQTQTVLNVLVKTLLNVYHAKLVFTLMITMSVNLVLHNVPDAKVQDYALNVKIHTSSKEQKNLELSKGSASHVNILVLNVEELKVFVNLVIIHKLLNIN